MVLHPAADHKQLDPVTFSGNAKPVSNMSAVSVTQEKYGLLQPNSWISTQICRHHTGEAWITTAEFQKHIII